MTSEGYGSGSGSNLREDPRLLEGVRTSDVKGADDD